MSNVLSFVLCFYLNHASNLAVWGGERFGIKDQSMGKTLPHGRGNQLQLGRIHDARTPQHQLCYLLPYFGFGCCSLYLGF